MTTILTDARPEAANAIRALRQMLTGLTEVAATAGDPPVPGSISGLADVAPSVAVALDQALADVESAAADDPLTVVAAVERATRAVLGFNALLTARLVKAYDA